MTKAGLSPVRFERHEAGPEPELNCLQNLFEGRSTQGPQAAWNCHKFTQYNGNIYLTWQRPLPRINSVKIVPAISMIVSRLKMNRRDNPRASVAEVFGSIKFTGKQAASHTRPWPATGFAVNKSTHSGQASLDDYKLIRSCN